MTLQAMTLKAMTLQATTLQAMTIQDISSSNTLVSSKLFVYFMERTLVETLLRKGLIELNCAVLTSVNL